MEKSGHTVSAVESGTRGELASKLVLADKARGVFGAGLLFSDFVSEGNIETSLNDMMKSCITDLDSSFIVASAVHVNDNGIEIGVALFRSYNKSVTTKIRGFGGHIDYAGEWAANVGLNLLRDCV